MDKPTSYTEGYSIQSHGVKMLSLVEKLEDLKVGFDNDTYLNEILQSRPLSYNSFVVNYNMNGLEKSIHELINMLVQYELTMHRQRKRQSSRFSEVCMHCQGKEHWKREYPQLLFNQGARKDEMILRLGDCKAVAAKAVGSVELAKLTQPPEKYGFVGLTSQLDNDPKTYGEAMSDIDSDKWLETKKSQMDSIRSNQVWTLVDPPKGVKPIGRK
ncbi:hypothetical protein Sango_2893200 [Sesamum angolense]|uniref:Uncharacterized protein n=1 Tax=Sesamum angolense TaxID=2727404 RepID=A0AAE1VV42_9LAMI|nr:hypothetical protein Sango_2893200 [Sesamum angolense]